MFYKCIFLKGMYFDCTAFLILFFLKYPHFFTAIICVQILSLFWLLYCIYRNPTPDWARNISWYQFFKYNMSYLYISEYSYMDLNYRPNHLAFWRDYYPTVSSRRASQYSMTLLKCRYSMTEWMNVNEWMLLKVVRLKV